MDPEKGNLCEYEKIPIVSLSEFEERVKREQIVLYHNLIVDYTDFRHPGYFKSIDQNRGKQISSSYDKKQHSYNADIILCQRTIGRVGDSPLQSQGRSFYERVKNSKINKKHEEILNKFDFSKPLNQNFDQLSIHELYVLTQVPKFLKNPQKALEMSYKTKWQKYYNKNHTLVNTVIFGLQILILVAFLLHQYSIFQIIKQAHFLFMGFLIWTLVEYLTHRFDYHHNMFQTQKFKGSDVHHCFPTVPESLSISVGSATPRLILIFGTLYFLLDTLELVQTMIGGISGIMFYNIFHYYTHYGSQFKIGWLRALSTHHLNHHFKDQHQLFGITSTIWDKLYKTMKPNKKKYKS